MSTDALFERVLGRAPTEDERSHVTRLQEATGIRDNDAFLVVLMTLEHYQTLSGRSSARLAAEAKKLLEFVRQAAAKAAAEESAKAQVTLAAQVAQTSATMAQELAKRPLRVDLVALSLALLVLFGSVCMAAGASLVERSGAWTAPKAGPVAFVLSAPAGWMAFAFLLPVLAKMGQEGGERAFEAGASRARKAWGWAMLAGSVVVAVGCLLVLFGLP